MINIDGKRIKRAPAPAAPPRGDNTVDAFHRLYYHAADSGGTWKNTFWRGNIIWKCPLDMWVYQEILWETQPEVIIECGTAFGGSALFLANMLDLFGGRCSRVITVDVTAQPNRPVNPRIEYITGSSVDPATVAAIKRRIRPGERVMVILDSDHAKNHVLSEMLIYGPLVSKGCYMIVEDGNVNGHPVYPSHGVGPAEAIAEFVPSHPEFQQDRTREKLLVTFNPGGYLKRVV